MTYLLTTPRLRIRIMRGSDSPVLVEYRNDPEVAHHQLWELPFTDASWLHDQDDLQDLNAGGTQLAIELDGRVIGDLYCHLDEGRAQAEVGYTLARRYWGHGYATEAALALVADLVDRVGVVRVRGELDPANVASQRVLEAIGLVHEADNAKSFWWRGEWTDNTTYSATADEWRAWRSRPTHPPADVALIPIDDGNQRRWRSVETHWSQRRLVAPVDVSYGDALFPPMENGGRLVPVPLGIIADGEPAGFCMYAAATATSPRPYLWRFLIDRRHQGRGIGRRALQALALRLSAEGHREIVFSFCDGPGSPRGFYLGVGAEPTGRVVDGEVEAVIALSRLLEES